MQLAEITAKAESRNKPNEHKPLANYKYKTRSPMQYPKPQTKKPPKSKTYKSSNIYNKYAKHHKVPNLNATHSI